MENKILQRNTKDSGVDWIKEVPRDWDVFKGKFFLKNKKETNKGMICDNVLSLTMRGVISRSELGAGGLVPSDYSTFQIFQNNDLVFKLIDLESHKTSRVGIVHERGIMSSAYIRIFPKNNKTINRYLYYYYFNLYTQGIYNHIGMGVRSTMNAKDLLELEILIPPKETQEKIVSFLNIKISNIDSLIEKKKLIIELLLEKRSSVILNAVTKGLDLDIKMKDSGIDWPTNIPVNWNIKKAKYVFKLIKRNPLQHDDTVTAFRDGQVTLRKNRRTEGFTNSLKEIGYQRIIKGDLVIHGMDAFAGAIGVSDSTGKCTPVYSVCNLKFDSNIYYFAYLIRAISKSGYIESLARGIRERSTDFRFSVFKELDLIIPSVEVQDKIVDFLDYNNEYIDNLISKNKEQIQLFKEYKSSLIYHAVTGKIEM